MSQSLHKRMYSETACQIGLPDKRGEPVTFEAPARIGYAESQSANSALSQVRMCHGVHWAFIVSQESSRTQSRKRCSPSGQFRHTQQVKQVRQVKQVKND